MNGFPIALRSGYIFWPILGMVPNMHFCKPFMIGLYHGNQKAVESYEYISHFVSEGYILREKGVKFNGRVLE